MLNALHSFDSKALDLDYEAAAREIEQAIQRIVAQDLRRQGIVLGVSGGIDSSVCAALAVRALGPERVCAILMPEKENSPKSTRLGTLLCEHLGVTPIMENITAPLTALGCYERRDNAIRRLFPEFTTGWKQKIGLAAGLLDADRVNYFTLTVESPDGERQSSRMPVDVYLDVVAATNLKQRIRKTVEYTHADRLNYAVLGTPNRLEYELGFFVRGGDGLADLKPIAHLYKSQVYGMAAHLGLPAEIQGQSPSTDTYTLPQSQEEFYYALPYDQLDLALCAYGRGASEEEAAAALGIPVEQVHRVYKDITSKRRTSARILRHAALVQPVDIGSDA
ncbi:NAD(+) synthase [Azospirillum doebereinerae]|uniref:NH(3)-dependent NAD(+) synthetase n=1 Tax=Azospirillum doebereinerae TaxID=92933 RepID=A0A3S0VK63_9PROT|nr:NAD(+) synthase [Azospirillum doebereinerae]MCG5241481.1 NAD(+) synthase [Azospirillum doebereinerae]RUQ74442.1 NAD(+) synthase [Azospirillum doebereinerae]